MFIKEVLGIPFHILTRDPASLAELTPLAGLVSNVGILLWGAAATVCFFAAIALRRSSPPETINFLLISGLLSVMLMADDLLIIHETLRDNYGIPELVTYGLYLTLIGLYLIRYRAILLNQNISLLGLAVVFMGASVGLDVVQKLVIDSIPGYFLVEDGLKLLGIASWASYFAYTARDLITAQISSGRSRLSHPVEQ